jgi:hypothetical protein
MAFGHDNATLSAASRRVTCDGGGSSGMDLSEADVTTTVVIAPVQAACSG